MYNKQIIITSNNHAEYLYGSCSLEDISLSSSCRIGNIVEKNTLIKKNFKRVGQREVSSAYRRNEKAEKSRVISSRDAEKINFARKRPF